MKEQYSERKKGSRALRFLLFSFAMLLAYAPAGMAQSIPVKGVVADASGDPLVGVSVTVKGTSTGTVTAVNGGYVINAPSSGTLVFSYLNFAKQEMPVDGRQQINIVMMEEATSMDEMVVIGYGAIKRQHLTGSVAVATNTEIAKSTTSNLSQALVGKLPGITTQQASGAPGSDGVTILIRGYSSYNGSTPLIIVDGVERPMGNLNANDIESVNVLKDAGSTAVYGLKAANGVILITTKRGSMGKAKVNYRGSMTLSHATTMPKMMNGTQYMQYYNLAQAMDVQAKAWDKGEEYVAPTPYYSDADIAATYNGDLSDGIENTNWMSQMYKTTTMHQHSLSVSGGSEAMKYFVSGSFLTQNGIAEGFKNQVANFRSNLDVVPAKNFKVSFNVATNVKDYYRPGAHSWDNWVSYNVFHVMMNSLPYVPKEWNGQPTSGYRRPSDAVNPEYGVLNSGFNKSRVLELQTSASIEYSAPFLKGLKAGMLAAWDLRNYKGKSFSHEYYIYGFDRSIFTAADRPEEEYGHADKGYSWVKAANTAAVEADGTGGSVYTDRTENQNVTLRPYISYSARFGRNDVGALFLYEQTVNNSSSENSSRRGYNLYDLPEIGLGSSATAQNGGSSGKGAFAAYVGRLNYAFDDKYLAEASFRYDGSYLFHRDHRWGFFPSASVGWVMSREDFFREALPKIEFFKLRASVGLTGASNVGAFLYRKIYNFSGNSVAFGSPAKSQGTLVNGVSYPMENLTWEKTRTTNVGFELGVWNGLLGVEFDWFYKYTYDILVDLSNTNIYPPSLGGHYPTRINNGTFDARGFELVLKHRNRIGSFTYGINGNITYTTNRILSRQQSDNVLPWQNLLGSSIGDIWGYKTDGLFQTEEELRNAPVTPGGTQHLGDIKYVDINGDGKITSEDRVKIANGRMPKMMYSLTLDGDWKGLDFSIQFQGAAMTDLMIQNQWKTTGESGAGSVVTDQTPLTRPFYAGVDNSPLYLVEGSWTENNRNAEYPRLSVAGAASGSANAWQSDWWKKNGAYLRLKNVVVGYTLPARWMQKINVDALRIYVSGNNLFTVTEFKWIDPESANVPTGFYPQQRTVSFGVDLSF